VAGYIPRWFTDLQVITQVYGYRLYFQLAWPLPFSHLTLWRPLLPYGTAIKHPAPDRVKPSLVVTFDIRDIRALWRSAISVIVPGCQKLQMMV